MFVEHVIEKHSGAFEYDICSEETHKSAFERLITEAMKMYMSERPVMNRKTGFRTNILYH